MSTVSNPTHRQAALALMDGRGPILDIARDVTQGLRAAAIPAAVVGGIAVVLHGHWRATRDIDILVSQPLEPIGRALVGLGCELDLARRQYLRDEIPIHLVLPEQTGMAPGRTVDIEGIVTVPLADLIAMKLRSGTASMLRAQDLADVIGLIRHHHLTGEFARQLDKALRPAFRRLVRAISREDT
jgi:hypothetical protein